MRTGSIQESQTPVWWPRRLTPLADTTTLAQTIDVMPTILSLCGIATPPTVQGRDLLPVLDRPGTLWPENHLFLESDSCQIGVRTANHLYAFRIDPDTHEVVEDPLYFFDVRQDPYQLHHMAQGSEQPELRRELGQRLHRWHARATWLQVAPANGGRGEANAA